MIELFREQNIAGPEWIAENGTVKIVFWGPSDLASGGQSGGQSNGINILQKKAKNMIRDNDRISVSLISKDLKVTTKTIYRDLMIIGIR